MNKAFQSNSTAGRTAREPVEQHTLPTRLVDIIDEYDARIGERDRYLWKWIHRVLPEVTLSSVSADVRELVMDAKLAVSMYVVLLDDVGEKHQDLATMRAVSKIPFSNTGVHPESGPVDQAAVEVAERIWSRYEAMLVEAPRRGEFSDIFEFDLKQTVNAIEYSSLLNGNLEMANGEENWKYDCHNMMLFTYLNTDLMFSPTFQRDELGPLRQATLRAQKLARIGNWITTWEREIWEGDFSSGVIVYALEEGIVSSDELYVLEETGTADDVGHLVDTIKDHCIEEHFLERWELIYQDLEGFSTAIESVDLDAYIEGVEKLLQYHLASRGRK